jgi:molybdopterin synthase sulfur carrier subunit
MSTLQLPLYLKKLAVHQERLDLPNGKLIDSLKELISTYPALKPYLLDDNENLCHFVNLYVNGQDIRFVEGLQTEVKEDDVIVLILAIAGG